MAVIADGRVEQVGPPEAVYREPATRFVAEFVGDNNLFEATVGRGDPPQVTVDGRTLVLPGLDLAPGANALLSVRPEALTVDPDGATGPTLEATVETSEFLGDAYRLHCQWGDRTLLVKTTGGAPPGGTVTLGIDPERVTIVDRGEDT